MRKVEKYAEMPLDERGLVTSPYNQRDSGRPTNGRMPGGILKNSNYSGSQYSPTTEASGSSRQPLMSERPSTFPALKPLSPVFNNDVKSYPMDAGLEGMPYRSTTEYSDTSFNTRKTYDKLADVYSASGDTMEFASNLRGFLNETIPGCVWILFLFMQIMGGLVCLFVGTFNFPYCAVQPMIPIFMISSGILLIINAIVRMIGHFPRQESRRNRSQLMSNLCFYGIEATILLAIVINIILGCVWVYGAKSRVHFEESMFEEHYCDWGLYWAAWWTVTLHLATFGLLVVACIFLFMYGSFTNP